MKIFKKQWIACLLALVLLTGCSQSVPTQEEQGSTQQSVTENSASNEASANTEENSTLVTLDHPVRVVALKGPTAMGLVKMMSDHGAPLSDDTSMVEQAKAMLDKADESVRNSLNALWDSAKEKLGESSISGEVSQPVEQPVTDADVPTGKGNEPYTFSIKNSPDEVVPMIVKSEADIFAIPSNLAATLYQKTQGNIVVLGINTMGMLQLVEQQDRIHSIEDLKGLTLYASGKSAVPQYVLDYLLEKSGLSEEDVNIQWKNEHAEVVAALSQDPDGVGLLPQPFVSAALAKNEKLRIAVDLPEEWAKKEPNHPMAIGVLATTKSFYEAHPDLVQSFLSEYAASIQFAQTQVDATAALIGAYGIVPAPIAKKALPHSYIVWSTGDSMKETLSNFLGILHQANPEAVGGTLPADDFYAPAAK